MQLENGIKYQNLIEENENNKLKGIVVLKKPIGLALISEN